jgi:hypothetical protein
MHIFIYRCEVVCYIMIHSPTWKPSRAEKKRDALVGLTTRRRRQDLQEPTVHSARFRSHWRRVRLYWDASKSLLARPKFYSSYKRRARRKPKCNLTLYCLTILPVYLPWAQRYRGNDACHLSTGDNPSGSSSITRKGVRKRNVP